MNTIEYICEECRNTFIQVPEHGMVSCPECYRDYPISLNDCQLNPDQFDDASILFNVECDFCSNGYEDHIDMKSTKTIPEQIASNLTDAGWGNRILDKYSGGNLCCPLCLKLSDDEL